MTFADSNGISFGLNASTLTATVKTDYLTSQSNQAASGQNGRFTFQTLSFSNANGVSFGTSAGPAFTASVAAQTVDTAGIYHVGNTTGQSSSSTYDLRTLSFRGDGAVSVGWSAASFWISAPVQTAESQSIGMSTQTAGGATAGTTGYASGAQVLYHLVPGSNITMSQSVNGASGTLSIFAPAAGAPAITQSHGISTATAGGSTAGTTGMVTGDDIQYLLVPGSNITMSQSIAGSSGTLSIYGPAAGGGATLSQLAPWIHGASGMLSTLYPGNASILVFPFPVEANYSFSRFMMSVSLSLSSSSNSSHGGTLSIGIGFYTRNVSTLSLATSGLGTYAWTNTSNNSTVSLSGIREVTGSFANMNLTEGDYWVGFWSRTSTVNANWFTANNIYMATGQSNSAHSGNFRSASAVASFQPGILGQGTFSATSAALPVSMAFSNITGSIRWWLRPHLQFKNFDI